VVRSSTGAWGCGTTRCGVRIPVKLMERGGVELHADAEHLSSGHSQRAQWQPPGTVGTAESQEAEETEQALDVTTHHAERGLPVPHQPSPPDEPQLRPAEVSSQLLPGAVLVRTTASNPLVRGADRKPRRKKVAICAVVCVLVATATLALTFGTVEGRDGPWPVGQPPRGVNSCAAAAEPGALCPIGCRRLSTTSCNPCPERYGACSQFGGCDPLDNWSGADANESLPVKCTCLVGFVGDRCSLKADFFSAAGATTVLLMMLTVTFMASGDCREKVLASCGCLRDRPARAEAASNLCASLVLPQTLREWLAYDPNQSSNCASWMEVEAGDSAPERVRGYALNFAVGVKVIKTLQLGAAAFSESIPWFEDSVLPDVLSIPALDIDSFLPDWFGFDLNFAWQLGGLVVLSRLLFPPNGMLIFCLKKYKTNVAKFPMSKAAFKAFVPTFLKDLDRKVPDEGNAASQWVDQLFDAADTDKTKSVDEKEWKVLLSILAERSVPVSTAKEAAKGSDCWIPENFEDSVRLYMYVNQRDPNVSDLWVNELCAPRPVPQTQDDWDAMDLSAYRERSAPIPEYEEEGKGAGWKRKAITACRKQEAVSVDQETASQVRSALRLRVHTNVSVVSLLADEMKMFVGEQALQRKKKLLPPQQLEALQLEAIAVLVIPMARNVSGIYLGCTYYDGAANTFDQDPSLSCWISPLWWLYAIVGIYGLFVLVTLAKATAHKIGDLSFRKQPPDYPATPQYGVVFTAALVFTPVISVAIGQWHPLISSSMIVVIHFLLLAYLLINQPYIHDFMNRLDAYGSIYNIVAYSCSIYATYVDDPTDDSPIMVYSWLVLVLLGTLVLIEAILYCCNREHHGRALSFPVANGKLMKTREFATAKADAKRLLTEARSAESDLSKVSTAMDACDVALRNMIADETSLWLGVEEVLGLLTEAKEMYAVLAKKEALAALDDAKQAMTAASYDKAVKALDVAKISPQKDHESVRELTSLYTEARDVHAALAKKEEGEKLLQTMTAASYAEAVQALDAAMALPQHERVKELTSLYTEAREVHAVLAKKEEGEKLLAFAKQAMTAASYAEAVQAFDAANNFMTLSRHDSVKELAGLRTEAKEKHSALAQKEWEQARATRQALERAAAKVGSQVSSASFLYACRLFPASVFFSPRMRGRPGQLAARKPALLSSPLLFSPLLSSSLGSWTGRFLGRLLADPWTRSICVCAM
jgi:hypothetical protein